MVEAGRIPGCPPGLEYLAQINSLRVQQLVEFIEVFTGFETNNKYVIRNQLNQQVYYAAEGKLQKNLFLFGQMLT